MKTCEYFILHLRLFHFCRPYETIVLMPLLITGLQKKKKKKKKKKNEF